MITITDVLTHVAINFNGKLSVVPKNALYARAVEHDIISLFWGEKLIASDFWQDFTPVGTDQNDTVLQLNALFAAPGISGISINNAGSFTNVSFSGFATVAGDMVTVLDQQVTQDGTVYVGQKTGSLQTGTMEEPFLSVNAAITYLDSLPLQPGYRIIMLGGSFNETTITIPDKMQNFVLMGLTKQVHNQIQTPRLIIENTTNTKFIAISDVYFQFTAGSGAGIEETGTQDIGLLMQGCNIEQAAGQDTIAVNSLSLWVYVLGYIANFTCNITDTKPFAFLNIFNNNLPEGNVNISSTTGCILSYVQNASLGTGVHLTVNECVSFIKYSDLRSFTHSGISIPGAIAAVIQHSAIQHVNIPGTFSLGDITLTNGGYRVDYTTYNNLIPGAATPL